MRVLLLLPLGSLGDINPFIGLGLGLRERGHEVVVIANSYFESMVKHAGLGFASSGPAESYLNIIRNPDIRHPKKGPALYVAGLSTALPQTFSIIEQLYQPGNTVLAAASLAFAARIAQEAFGIPLATIDPNPLTLPSAHAARRTMGNDLVARLSARWRLIHFKLTQRIFRQPTIDDLLTREVNSFRAKFGLEPVRRIVGFWNKSPQRVIGLWPEWFYGPQPDWPPQAVVTGFIEYDGAPASVQMTDCTTEEDPGGKPPIVFTASTACFSDVPFFTAATEACEILKWPGILLTQQENPIRGSLPGTVRHIRYAPLGELLSRAAAIVHQGGVGTCARALKAGIPQIVMPTVNDQYDNARRVVHLGVGTSIDRRHFTGRRLAVQLRELLESQPILDQCRRYTTKFHSTNALEKTCEYIEALP